MKKITLALFFASTVFFTQAQEHKHKPFLLMSSYGYMHSEQL